MYSLYHRNVDGAGHVADFDTLAEAKAEADRQQAEADAMIFDNHMPDGRVERTWNPWCYSYVVFGHRETRHYQTEPNYHHEYLS